MSIYDFLSLNDADKANAVWSGTFLSSRMEAKLSVLLYELGGFYVEVYYCAGENRIVRLRPFKKTSVLEPYLDELNIKDLL